MKALIAAQASTIATLQAQLAALQATTFNPTPAQHQAAAKPKSKTSAKDYLGYWTHFKWSEKYLLQLLQAVSEVATSTDISTTEMDDVLAAYRRITGSTHHSLTVKEIEYALGKVHHDGYRGRDTASICTAATKDYMHSHPEISQFFIQNLGTAPYYGPN